MNTVEVLTKSHEHNELFDEKILVWRERQLYEIKKENYITDSSLDKLDHPAFLVVIIDEKGNALRSIEKTMSTSPNSFKKILLVPRQLQLKTGELCRLMEVFSEETNVGNQQLLAAAAQGSSSSKFRSLDSIRGALRNLKEFGVPKFGAIVEVESSDSIHSREISWITSAMKDFLGSRKKLRLLVKPNEKKDSFNITVINMGISFSKQSEEADLGLFQMEPECGREQRLGLDLAIPKIME